MGTTTCAAGGSNVGVRFAGKMVGHNRGESAGGTLNGTVWSYATSSGGTFKGDIGNLTEGDTTPVIRGKSAGSLKIDCGIGYYYGIPAQIFQPCEFGPKATVSVENNEGTIEVTMTVHGVDVTYEYNDKILESLTAPFGEGGWYAVAGETQTRVDETINFAPQQTH